MQKALLFKFLIIFGLIGLLLIPISLINGTVKERKYNKSAVASDIAKIWTGQQTVRGVVFVAPYKQKTLVTEQIFVDGERTTVEKEKMEQKYAFLLPDNLTVKGSIDTQERYRGIYKIPVYTTQLHFSGDLGLVQNLDFKDDIEDIQWGQPYISIGISDMRGINQVGEATINSQKIAVEPQSRVSFLHKGVHIPLDFDLTQNNMLSFSVELTLQGMEKLSFAPLGKNVDIQISSPWPHPSFIGRYSPQAREISADGFSASWKTSNFATDIVNQINICTNDKTCEELNDNTLGVELLQGVDLYVQVERSIKYALLFIGLTFGAFFLFEIIKTLPIHPIQYGLVGMAMSLFYLLLISLSEHISFVTSYAIASFACVGLLSFYVSYVLRSFVRGMGFSVCVAGLYAFLYIIIQSEDYALLMGSAMTFGILAYAMFATRKIDWYQVDITDKSNDNKTEKTPVKPS